MKLWVENQFIAGGNFVTSFEDKWLKYQEKKRGIKYTKRGREVTQSRSSIDEFGEKVWKTPKKIKSREQFKEDFIKDISWAIINSIHSFGSKQQYRTYTDDNTGKLINVQHFNGAEKWMKPEYKELYKDVNEQGYREI